MELEEEIRARLMDIKAGKNVDQEDIILLLYRQNENLGEAAMVKNMVDELKIFIIAGSDTTSTLVTNCLYHLSTVPHVLA
jgi:cytochrome P450